MVMTIIIIIIIVIFITATIYFISGRSSTSRNENERMIWRYIAQYMTSGKTLKDWSKFISEGWVMGRYGTGWMDDTG